MSLSPNSRLMKRTLDLQYENTKRANSLKWSVINGVLIVILVYDLSCRCPGYMTTLHYVEYALVVIATISLIQHSYLLAKRSPPLDITNRQKELLGVSDADTSFRIIDTSLKSAPSVKSLNASDSLSISLSPRGWRTREAGSRSASASPPEPMSHSRIERNPDRFIADSSSLSDYLRQYEECSMLETSLNVISTGPPPAPVSHYHLASIEKESKLEDASSMERSGLNGSPQVWWKLQLDPQRLTHWNLNLRLVQSPRQDDLIKKVPIHQQEIPNLKVFEAENVSTVIDTLSQQSEWLHVTIVERLVKEMAAVEDSLSKAGLHDVKLGQVSVERLRQSAKTGSCGSLATVLPFLEAFPDQKYLVQRIKELSVGGCLSNYKWNGGGLDFDDSKPTDAEIVLHLLAAYLDGQLPSGAGEPAKAFSTGHMSCAPAAPPSGPDALAIHKVASRPPHYVLALADDTIEVCRGRNNLLHTVLLLIAACARKTPPSLNRVHLGPAGLNMLWIIS